MRDTIGEIRKLAAVLRAEEQLHFLFFGRILGSRFDNFLEGVQGASNGARVVTGLQIVPSIFAADFMRLGEDIGRVQEAGVQMIHVDIMDGHFVPNFTMGTPITESIRRATDVQLDHHLMIEDPDTYAPIFIKAGADCVSVHYEVCRNLDRTLHMIQDLGARAGVVLNPATPVFLLENVLNIADYVLVMSVNPGYGGQKFIPNSLSKVRELVRLRSERGLGFAIEIDGGVGLENVADIARAGVDWAVAGSSVFGASNAAQAVHDLQKAAHEAFEIKV